MRILARLRQWLFNARPTVQREQRRDVTKLLQQLVEGQVRRVSDDDLIALVEELGADPRYKVALRGNTRFLRSVATHFARKRRLTMKQRYAVYNILERAFPRNLPADLLRPSNRR